MKDFLLLLIQGVMDAIEEFFESLTAPSSKFTFKAFLYSVAFLVGSVVMSLFGIPCFVSWQEALTCVILMSLIVLIDSSVRSNIKTGMLNLKSIAEKFSYRGEEEGDEESVDKEEDYDGTGE